MTTIETYHPNTQGGETTQQKIARARALARQIKDIQPQAFQRAKENAEAASALMQEVTAQAMTPGTNSDIDSSKK